MTHNDAASASDAIKGELVQGLRAYMASEAKAAATDTQLEAAAKTYGPQPYYTMKGFPKVGCESGYALAIVDA